MNTHFTTSHLQTLQELVAIAESHNCYINFGTSADSCAEILDELLLEKGFDNVLLDELNYNVETANEHFSIYDIWFELFDRNTGKSNILSYTQLQTSFSFNELGDDVSYTLQDKLKEMDTYGDRFISVRSDETKIHGFNQGDKICHLVYRPGMALKFFGDYVCDYLGVPRIERVY